MSWSNREKAIVKRYQRAAGLPDQLYRTLLYEQCGAMSSTHPKLTQGQFDRFMPFMELKLEEAVNAGRATWPDGMRPDYWRKRSPQKGEVNSRQTRKIWELWGQLKQVDQSVPGDAVTYMVGMAKHACCCQITDFFKMRAWQANLLIEALKGRIAEALKRSA